MDKRTGARYELQRNFKGDDSPGVTDLSARLSFTKRALEVKAPNEVVVFKEDYPRDDKSIEDDERPNRSRVCEASGMYRKFISDAEKFGKEISERSGNLKDVEDVRISCVADENLKRPNNKCQNEVINDIYCDHNPRNIIIAPKIKRKRISRGIQYTLIGCQNHDRRFLLNCFGSKSSTKKYNLTQKVEKKEALTNKKKFHVGSRNEVNKSSLDATTIRNESHHNIKLSNTDVKKENFENDMKKIGKMIYEQRMDCKKLFVQSQNTDDDEKRKKFNNSKNRKVKINPFEKLWPGKDLMRKIVLKTQRNKLPYNFNVVDDSENNKKETAEGAESNFKNNRMNGARNRECDSRGEWNEMNVNIFDRTINSNNARESAITNSNGESIANKVKERLDSCIVELNEIIDDACVVFDSGKKRSEKNS